MMPYAEVQAKIDKAIELLSDVENAGFYSDHVRNQFGAIVGELRRWSDKEFDVIANLPTGEREVK